ncbi:PPC domain-containing protein [Brevundimonas sp.]|uniref:PPC domain-containing protein n=1 Tax=Brevundimonas sp. TaxID=1871086 RepID=UPI002731C89F|nr:PPC domain-containing protein [Brevundimonas sp.]MDP1913711.1 PPC domain-containing protein [Brevundimonas sp.]
MRRKTILVAVSLLALSVAAPVLAQQAETLSPGRTVEGQIADGDGTAADDAYRYDDYLIRARAGQRMEAVMRSEAFDAYLEVFHQGDAEAMASDDDGLGEGTHSRLRFTADRAGTYVLRARTLSGIEGGAYTLGLTQRPPAGRAPRPTGIRVGQSIQGALTAGDPESEGGQAYDAYAFRARAGDRFSIDLSSEAFDSVVRVGQMRAGEFNELAMNDDTLETGLNSRLIFTAAAGGDYIIRATPLSPGDEGTYTLALARGPELAAAQALEIGGSVNGSLAEGDGKGADGATADVYQFSGQEGQRVRIDMSSEEFDTYVELFDANHVSLAEDDDGAAEGTNSRLTFTLPRSGVYFIEARAFTEATGGYSLSVSEVEPEKAPETLAFGSLIQGEISEADPTDSEDRGFDAFAFSGVAGQRVQAIMRSGDFDTYLQVGRAGTEFEALASDDDGLGEGTDSRLSYTLPEDGDYVLRVSPLGSDAKGLYALELNDRGPQPQPGSVLVGATARGILTEADATAEDNSFYDAYRVTLKEDEKLLITMVSNEVDSFLVVGREQDGGAFEVLGSDDDSLSDTHAKLEWTAPADGVYEVRAGTFQQGQTGAYALNVEKQP